MPNYPTAVAVYDPATLAKAFATLGEIAKTGEPWQPAEGCHSAVQSRFLHWCATSSLAVSKLANLRVQASNNADVLNRFLQDNGFAAMFRRLDRGGVGAAAVLKITLEWIAKASKSAVVICSGGKTSSYQTFTLPCGSFEVYDTIFGKLIRLLAKGGGSAWLIVIDKPYNCMDMVDIAGMAMDTKQRSYGFLPGVEVPCVDIKETLQIPWMVGVRSGDCVIEQIFQTFEVKIDEAGADAGVASGLAITKSFESRFRPLRIDQPFLGWFTQPGSEVPMTIYYAGLDAWRSVD